MQPAAARSTQESKLSTSAEKLKNFLKRKLPVSEEALKDVLKLIKTCSTEELFLLGLQPPPLPTLGQVSSMLPLQERLEAVQAVISSLQYNHTSAYYYNVSKQRSLQAILSTAAGILRDPLPIKCIEAVFLGMLLTQGWEEGQLQRIPVGFKSMAANGQVYRHIVLVVYDPSSNCYGGLGISRRDNLMYKPLSFTSLAELMQDYIKAYSYWHHVVLKIRVGLPVEHDPEYMGPVCWRYCVVNPQKRSWDSVANILNNHAAAASKLQGEFRAAAAAASNTGAGSASNPGSLTPRSPAVKPHITKPYANGGGSPVSEQNTSASGPSGLRSSRQGLDTVQVAANGTRKCPMSPVRQANIAASSCSSKASPLNSPRTVPYSLDVKTVSSSISCIQQVRSKLPVLSSSLCGLQQLSGSVLGLSHDACDSSSDEADGTMSVCTFDSDSEINVIVDSMRHKRYGSPCRRAAHAS